MTDNSVIPVSVGTETFANKDIGGIKYPRVVATWGGAGVANDTDDATGKRIPVKAEQGAAGATAWKVDGSAVTQPISHAGIPAALGAHSAMKIEGVASGTLVPVTVDPAQLGTLVRGAVPVINGGLIDFPVAANSADITLEVTTGTGHPGDLLDHLVCTVSDPATCQVYVRDGGTSFNSTHLVLPPALAAGISVQHIILGGISVTGAWHVGTGPGVNIRAFGNFSS